MKSPITDMPDFGTDGLKGLTEKQKQDLSNGNIIFSTSDSNSKEKGALIEAVVLFNLPIDKTWQILYKTEDQNKYLDELDKIDVIKKEPNFDTLEFKVKVVFKTIVYRVIHNFEHSDYYMYWALDPSFKNDLLELRGFWRLYTYEGNRTLARYGSNVSIKNVPSFIENMFKKNGVEKSIKAIKKYVDSNGSYHK
ncbi:MAG: hypothetical protein HQK79_05005 [Desulfobacterales bacterium]|nr:hypothetical protein [Desulfobacterales bacterium]MBF0397583.1 hypothetical protein [Desulfobacterales bacterium]